jgi:hypothetical protein
MVGGSLPSSGNAARLPMSRRTARDVRFPPVQT